MATRIIFCLLFFTAKIFAQNPVAQFSHSGDGSTDCIYFTSNSTGNIVSTTWTIYEVSGPTVFTQNFTYCFSDTGCYDVKLVVQDNFGVSDSITQSVCIHHETAIFMPNAFTPNGDGMNDIFFVYGYLIPENKFEMRIYDYWGGLVFYTFDLNKGWDGRHDRDGRNVVQNGVYLVELIWFDLHNEKHSYRGSVFLFK